MPAASPVLCLRCCRRKLAGAPLKPCGSCILLNIDPLARVRARASWPSRVAGLAFTAACATAPRFAGFLVARGAVLSSVMPRVSGGAAEAW